MSLKLRWRGLALAGFLYFTFPGANQARPLQDNIDIQIILSRCAEYCAKLRSSALNFVCEEKIAEEVFRTKYRMVSTSGSRTVSYSTPSGTTPGRYLYRYDYQLITNGAAIEEKRTLLEYNKKKVDAGDASVKPRRFYSANPVFGPVGFFDRNWHDLYDYKLLKRERVLDRDAYAISVKPKTVIENKPNYGTIWVDVEDYSVLKIEVEAQSLAGYEQVLETAKNRGLEPVFVTVHEYAVMKNGLRFPSRTLFEEKYKGRVDGFLGGTKSKTDIIYENYRFFTVETDAVIK